MPRARIHAVTEVNVNAITGSGSSIWASTGEVAENTLAKKLQNPSALAAKATGKMVECET